MAGLANWSDARLQDAHQQHLVMVSRLLSLRRNDIAETVEDKLAEADLLAAEMIKRGPAMGPRWWLDVCDGEGMF